MHEIKGLAFVLLLMLCVAASLPAQVVEQHLLEDVKAHPSCSYCGMDRQQFSRSRVLIRYEDGSTMAACSLHCAAVDLAVAIDKNPQTIQVADYGTGKLIDAESATWVIGGSKLGVMTQRAKWAFEKKADAEAFMKQNGGTHASFDEAMKATYEDMYADTKMIRERRKMRRRPMSGMQGPMPSHSHQ